MRHSALTALLVGAAAALTGLTAGCGSSHSQSTHATNTGNITAHVTTFLKSHEATHGALAGTGHFTISGAIRDEGKVSDYRKVDGNLARIRRVAHGRQGTITFLITIHLDAASRERWTIASGTKTYKGLHGSGLEVVDNYDSVPATFVQTGTVSSAG
jgi:hypothetical protein